MAEFIFARAVYGLTFSQFCDLLNAPFAPNLWLSILGMVLFSVRNNHYLKSVSVDMPYGSTYSMASSEAKIRNGQFTIYPNIAYQFSERDYSLCVLKIFQHCIRNVIYMEVA